MEAEYWPTLGEEVAITDRYPYVGFWGETVVITRINRTTGRYIVGRLWNGSVLLYPWEVEPVEARNEREKR